MNSIFLTGDSGFVGANLVSCLSDKFNFSFYSKGDSIEIEEDIVIHLAGKSHDTGRTLPSDNYYQVNTELTKSVFDSFLTSGAKVFITLSSVKAVADNLEAELTEEYSPNPLTHYGKSKLLADQYILSKGVPSGKRVYILRPCLIHGPGNKGNLKSLYNLVSMGIPWPLGAFNNKRSFCSIDNLLFIIKELIGREDIPSGVYNVADDQPLSTNQVISILAESQGRNPRIWNVPKIIVLFIAEIGDKLRLPLNKERLHKLTDSYIVSNKKIKMAIRKPLPFSSREGLLATFNYLNK